MEALGRLIEVVPAGRVFVTGGLSGSGWPLGPSDFHMYWSLPKLIAEMAPEKKLREPPAPSNASLPMRVRLVFVDEHQRPRGVGTGNGIGGDQGVSGRRLLDRRRRDRVCELRRDAAPIPD